MNPLSYESSMIRIFYDMIRIFSHRCYFMVSYESSHSLHTCADRQTDARRHLQRICASCSGPSRRAKRRRAVWNHSAYRRDVSFSLAAHTHTHMRAHTHTHNGCSALFLYTHTISLPPTNPTYSHDSFDEFSVSTRKCTHAHTHTHTHESSSCRAGFHRVSTPKTKGAQASCGIFAETGTTTHTATHTAKHCNTHCNTHCSTPTPKTKGAETSYGILKASLDYVCVNLLQVVMNLMHHALHHILQYTATHCNTLLHVATHTATHYMRVHFLRVAMNLLQPAPQHTLQHTHAHCSTLCNTHTHTATHSATHTHTL